MAKDEYPSIEDDDEEGSEEEPAEEADDEEEVEEGYGFERAIQNLQKQINDFSRGMNDKIVSESEKRLAKMGF